MKPHIIRKCDFIKVRNLKIGEVFYHDFDNFTHFSTTHKRAVETFEEDGAIVQIYHREEDGSWGFNVKTKYSLDDEVYVLRGEKVSIW